MANIFWDRNKEDIKKFVREYIKSEYIIEETNQKKRKNEEIRVRNEFTNSGMQNFLDLKIDEDEESYNNFLVNHELQELKKKLFDLREKQIKIEKRIENVKGEKKMRRENLEEFKFSITNIVNELKLPLEDIIMPLEEIQKKYC